MNNTMLLLFEKNETWISIVKSFGCNVDTSQDIVQEMYIKIQLKLEKGLDIDYNDEVNYYYIFKTLQTLFYDLKRKEKRVTIINIDDVQIDKSDEDVDYDKAYKKVTDELSQSYWYDRKIFEIINGGESIAELSRKSEINYYSLYNTYNKMKNKLIKLI